MERIKITRLPLNWPTDKRTKRSDTENQIIITHPDRQPHVSNDGRNWTEIKTFEYNLAAADKVYYL